MKYIGIGILSFFAALILLGVLSVTLEPGPTLQAVDGWSPVFVLGLPILVPILVRRGARGKHKRTENESMAEEVITWFGEVDQNRRFSTYRPQRAIMKPDEFAILSGETSLFELIRPNHRDYIGTRVKLGGLPIYLGQSFGSTKAWAPTDTGEIVITNQRVLFVGHKRQINFGWDLLVGIEAMRDGIIVSISNHATPIGVLVDNGLLWAEACKFLARHRLSANEIPPWAQRCP